MQTSNYFYPYINLNFLKYFKKKMSPAMNSLVLSKVIEKLEGKKDKITVSVKEGNKIIETEYNCQMVFLYVIRTYKAEGNTKLLHSFEGEASEAFYDGETLYEKTWHVNGIKYRENGPSEEHYFKDETPSYQEYTNSKGEIHRDEDKPAKYDYEYNRAGIKTLSVEQYYINKIRRRKDINYPSYIDYNEDGSVSHKEFTDKEGKLIKLVEYQKNDGCEIIIEKIYN